MDRINEWWSGDSARFQEGGCTQIRISHWGPRTLELSLGKEVLLRTGLLIR